MDKRLVAPKVVVLESISSRIVDNFPMASQGSPLQLTYPSLQTLAPHGTPRLHTLVKNYIGMKRVAGK